MKYLFLATLILFLPACATAEKEETLAELVTALRNMDQLNEEN